MDQQSGKLWLLKAFGIFLLGLVFWFILAVWAGTSYALDLSFAQDLRSNLLADYGDSFSNQDMKSLSLTILGDVFSDQDITDNSIGFLKNFIIDPIPVGVIAADLDNSAPTPTNTQPDGPSIESTKRAVVTENSPDLLPLKETSTPSPTMTPTGTLMGISVPTSTKTEIPTRTPDPTISPSETPIIDEMVPIRESAEQRGGRRWEVYFDQIDLLLETQDNRIRDRDHLSLVLRDRMDRTSFSSDRSQSLDGTVANIDKEENAARNHFLGESSGEAWNPIEFWNDDSMPSSTFNQTVTSRENRLSFFNRWHIRFRNRFLDDPSLSSNVEFTSVDDQPQPERISDAPLEGKTQNPSTENASEPSPQVVVDNADKDGWSEQSGGSGSDCTPSGCQSPEPETFRVNFWARIRERASREGWSFTGNDGERSWWGRSSDGS